MMTKWLFLAGAVVVLLGGGLFGYRKWNANTNGGATYEPVEFRRQRMEAAIESTGVVKPRNRLEIKAPIGGRIDEVLVVEGQQVKKGEIIARMSSTERAALLDAARAKGEDVVRKWEDAYKATSLMAPLDGTIIARNTEPGQTITAQDAVLVLSDKLIVNGQVDETDVGRVKVGQPVRIKLDAYPDVRIEGKVKRVAYDARTVNNVTIYEVEIEPDHVPDCMKSGMTATVTFQVAVVEDALTLPVNAVVKDNGKSAVWVDDGHPKTPPEAWRILTGVVSGGRVEVLAGLEGTERVVRTAFAMPVGQAAKTSPFMPSRRR
jgi:macrolide-specific efflux system membrane fusion protein